jgi:membrane-associated phospholipid phosphatase
VARALPTQPVGQPVRTARETGRGVGRIFQRAKADGVDHVYDGGRDVDRLRLQLQLERPLLTDAARLRAAAVLACCAILVAVLGVLFADQSTADRLDSAVDSPVIGLFGGHGDLAFRLASPGTLMPAFVLSGVTVVICLLTGRPRGAVLAAAAVPVADGLDDGLLKHIVHRTYLGQLTYPSGHTTAVFAIAATVTILLLNSSQPIRTRRLRLLIAGAAYVVGVIVGLAVMALRWHYFTDTVAGAAVGIGTVCALALILDLPVIGRWVSRPGEPSRARSSTPGSASRHRRQATWSRGVDRGRPDGGVP